MKTDQSLNIDTGVGQRTPTFVFIMKEVKWKCTAPPHKSTVHAAAATPLHAAAWFSAEEKRFRDTASLTDVLPLHRSKRYIIYCLKHFDIFSSPGRTILEGSCSGCK